MMQTKWAAVTNDREKVSIVECGIIGELLIETEEKGGKPSNTAHRQFGIASTQK